MVQLLKEEGEIHVRRSPIRLLNNKLLRKNVFQPTENLKQMDLYGGALNYEGFKVLNSVEALLAYHGDKKRVRSRLICTPAC